MDSLMTPDDSGIRKLEVMRRESTQIIGGFPLPPALEPR
jgi:hypothetical protein